MEQLDAIMLNGAGEAERGAEEFRFRLRKISTDGILEGPVVGARSLPRVRERDAAPGFARQGEAHIGAARIANKNCALSHRPTLCARERAPQHGIVRYIIP